MANYFICTQCGNIFDINHHRFCSKCNSLNVKPYNKPHKTKDAKLEKKPSNIFLYFIIIILVSWIGYNEVKTHFFKKERTLSNQSLLIYERDKKALELAKKIGTIESYQNFLNKYPDSVWCDYAIYFRDKVAYREAINANSVEAIVNFLYTYPDSSWVPNARYTLKHTFGYSHESEVNIQ